MAYILIYIVLGAVVILASAVSVLFINRAAAYSDDNDTDKWAAHSGWAAFFQGGAVFTILAMLVLALHFL